MKNELEFLLNAANAELVEVATLPDEPGGDPEEAGLPGPWYGIRLANGEVQGWSRDPVFLTDLLVPLIEFECGWRNIAYRYWQRCRQDDEGE